MQSAMDNLVVRYTISGASAELNSLAKYYSASKYAVAVDAEYRLLQMRLQIIGRQVYNIHEYIFRVYCDQQS